jgi:hypothetical protein
MSVKAGEFQTPRDPRLRGQLAPGRAVAAGSVGWRIWRLREAREQMGPMVSPLAA